MLGISRSTPNALVYGEVGRKPLRNKIHSRMISFWIKISEGKSSKLSTKIYNLIYQMHLNGSYHSPWLMSIKKILCDSGNPNFWFNQVRLTPKIFMKNIISNQLDSQYLQEWNFEINRNRRCLIYNIFKNTIAMEPYLKDLDFLERRALCKFRTGSHNLPITKRRYNDDEDVDVQCKFCDSNYCDEFHVLFKCEYFKEQRKLYLKQFYYVRPSAFKMISLFNSCKKETSNLAKFCKFIASKFQ